ncbi:MAG: hypothetical protein LBU91_00685, partial [Bacteroidales bacterium]|nr:hypothetical protein [Bacteroidales bacterium]
MKDFIDFFTQTERLGDGRRMPTKWAPFLIVWLSFLIFPILAFRFAKTGGDALLLNLLNGILMFILWVVLWIPISVIMSRIAIIQIRKKEENIVNLLHDFLDDLCSKEEIERFINQINLFLTTHKFGEPVPIKLNYDSKTTEEEIKNEIGYYAYETAIQLNKNGTIVNKGKDGKKNDGCGSFFFQTFRSNFPEKYTEMKWSDFLKERSIEKKTGKKRYTHTRLRSAFLSVKRNMK